MTKRNPPDDLSKTKNATTQTIEDETRQSIATFLPDAIAQALKSYYRFSQQSASYEAKEFSAHHNACKVAIAHIELLIKLARWADLPDQEQAEQNNDQVILMAMVQEAQKELSLYKKNSDEAEATSTLQEKQKHSKRNICVTKEISKGSKDEAG